MVVLIADVIHLIVVMFVKCTTYCVTQSNFAEWITKVFGFSAHDYVIIQAAIETHSDRST